MGPLNLRPLTVLWLTVTFFTCENDLLSWYIYVITCNSWLNSNNYSIQKVFSSLHSLPNIFFPELRSHRCPPEGEVLFLSVTLVWTWVCVFVHSCVCGHSSERTQTSKCPSICLPFELFFNRTTRACAYKGFAAALVVVQKNGHNTADGSHK